MGSRVLPSPPELDYGGFVEDVKERADGSVACTYCHVHDCGLYSNMSTIMASVLVLTNAGFSVDRIDTSRTFSYYKNAADEDVYPKLFSGICGNLVALSSGLTPDEMIVHQAYRALPLARYGAFARALFSPSHHVISTMQDLTARHRIEPHRTIAVYYRGTDKSTEVTLGSVDEYIAVCGRLLDEDRKARLLVQTDQAQVLDRITKAFPDRSFHLPELPATEGDNGIHRLRFSSDLEASRPDIERRLVTQAAAGPHMPLTREDFAVLMLAMVEIIASCSVVVGHTGNAAAWIAYKRGSAEALYQFGADGRLIEPSVN